MVYIFVEMLPVTIKTIWARRKCVEQGEVLVEDTHIFLLKHLPVFARYSVVVIVVLPAFCRLVNLILLYFKIELHFTLPLMPEIGKCDSVQIIGKLNYTHMGIYFVCRGAVSSSFFNQFVLTRFFS